MINITVNRDALVAALSRVKRAAGKSSLGYITNTVKLSTDPYSRDLELNCTDLNTHIMTTVCCGQKLDAGAITLDLKDLSGLKHIAECDLAIRQTDNKHATIETATVKLGLVGCDAQDFPREPMVVEPTSFRVDAVKFCTAFDIVNHAVADNNSRPVLAGVHWTSEYMEAADGYRMARGYMELPTADGLDLIVPIQALRVFRAIIGLKPKGEVLVNYTNIFIRLIYEDTCTRVDTARIDGTFPNTSHLIPDRNASAWHFSASPKQMLAALCVIPSARTDVIRLERKATEHAVGITYIDSTNSWDGSAVTTDASQTFVSRFPTQADLSVAFKVALQRYYFEQAIKTASKHAMTMEMYGTIPEAPVAMSWFAQGGKQGELVIMPMFVRW